MSARRLRDFYEEVGEKETLKDAYESLLPSKRFFYQDRFKTVLKTLGDSKGKNVIDVGCGLGVYSVSIALKGAAFIVALDLSESFLKKARELALKRNVRSLIDFVLADAQQLPFKVEAFDLSLCTEVVEHLEKPLETLKELWRVSKAGNRVVITVPSAYSYVEAERKKRLAKQKKFFEHLHSFTLKKFKKNLEVVGFKVESVEGCFFYFPGFASLFNRLPALLPILKFLRVIGYVPWLNQLGWCLVFKAYKGEPALHDPSNHN